MEEAQRRIDEWVREGDNTKKLNLADLGLTELPPLPEGLTQLSCDGNKLASLPSLPEGLTNFYCRGNQLTLLLSLPEALTTFVCYDNPIFYPPADKIDNLFPQDLRDWMCKNPYSMIKSANKH